MTDQQRRWRKRRQAIEPTIGHTLADNGMRRCWLKGSKGDTLHAALCVAGFNNHCLLRAIARKGHRRAPARPICRRGAAAMELLRYNSKCIAEIRTKIWLDKHSEYVELFYLPDW